MTEKTKPERRMKKWLLKLINHLCGRVRDLGGCVRPVGRLVVLRVRDHGLVNPVGWLLGAWILDGLGLQKVPVVGKVAGLDLGAVNLDLVRVVGVDNQSVPVREFISLASA